MGTIYDRSLWKKRSLRGYHPQYVKDRISEIRDAFEEKKHSLESELETLLGENHLLQKRIENLNAELIETKPRDEVLYDQILGRFLETTQHLLDVKKETQQQKEALQEKVFMKEEERNQLVERLKGGLHHLHELKIDK